MHVCACAEGGNCDRIGVLACCPLVRKLSHLSRAGTRVRWGRHSFGTKFKGMPKHSAIEMHGILTQ